MKFGNVQSIYLSLIQQNSLKHYLFAKYCADSGVQWGTKPDLIDLKVRVEFPNPTFWSFRSLHYPLKEGM